MSQRHHAGQFFIGTEAERLAASVRNGAVWYQTDSTPGFWDYYNGWIDRRNLQASAQVELYLTSSHASENARLVIRRSRGSVGSESAVQSNDILGQVYFGGYGTAYDNDGAVVEAVANQTWTGSAHGTRLVFYITPDGATAKVEGARLTASGQFSLPISGTDGGLSLASELLLYRFGTGVLGFRGTSANATMYMSPSGSTGSVEFRFYNNNFGTLKGRFIYPDTNPSGHKYVGFINDGGDYLVLWTLNGTDILINPSSAETARFTSAALNMASGKVIQVAGTQIMTSRRIGWTAATGTATRTTFDTATVTLEQLAQRVKALIDDFITHGAIGT
jgi:hypothetical protein